MVALTFLFMIIMISLLIVTLWLYCHHRYKLLSLTLTLIVALCLCKLVTYYENLNTAMASDAESIYNSSYKENLQISYKNALPILESLDFNNPDTEAANKAVRLLQNFGNVQTRSELKDACPDADVLLAYAKAMQQVATYNGHMKNEDVSHNQKLLSEVQNIPDMYSGQLAKKIRPFRQVIIAMNQEALKCAELDRQNAAKHEENMKKGRYGKIRPGDSEDGLTAAMGQPVRVNVSRGAGEETLKQYVFQHNTTYIYVYTKDGIVTEVSK